MGRYHKNKSMILTFWILWNLHLFQYSYVCIINKCNSLSSLTTRATATITSKIANATQKPKRGICYDDQYVLISNTTNKKRYL